MWLCGRQGSLRWGRQTWAEGALPLPPGACPPCLRLGTAAFVLTSVPIDLPSNVNTKKGGTECLFSIFTKLVKFNIFTRIDEASFSNRSAFLACLKAGWAGADRPRRSPRTSISLHDSNTCIAKRVSKSRSRTTGVLNKGRHARSDICQRHEVTRLCEDNLKSQSFRLGF